MMWVARSSQHGTEKSGLVRWGMLRVCATLLGVGLAAPAFAQTGYDDVSSPPFINPVDGSDGTINPRNSATGQGNLV